MEWSWVSKHTFTLCIYSYINENIYTYIIAIYFVNLWLTYIHYALYAVYIIYRCFNIYIYIYIYIYGVKYIYHIFAKYIYILSLQMTMLFGSINIFALYPGVKFPCQFKLHKLFKEEFSKLLIFPAPRHYPGKDYI